MALQPDTSSEAVGDVTGSFAATQPPESEREELTQVPEEDDSQSEHGGSVPWKKRKRRKKKTAASRGATALPKGRGTGFEEYYADPPMTPAEAAEEQTEIYAPGLSFAERIQSCIQRFRSRRRLQGLATLYFSEYLFLGGIDTNPGAFTGQDPRDLKELTPAERREATARDVVYSGSEGVERFYNGDDEHWSVDFAGVAAGFFSTAMVQLTGLQEEQTKIAISIVENFLRYVVQHDVCPEYTNNLNEALELCNTVREEWPMVQKLKAALPGKYHLAAARNFSVASAEDWANTAADHDELDPASVFYAAVALTATPGLPSPRDGFHVASTFDCTLEVMAVLLPDVATVQLFNILAIDDKPAGIPPIGRAKFKLATIEDAWDHPVIPSPFTGNAEEEVTISFDDTVLAHMKPGMKMAMTLCQLENGILFIKTIASVVPSFYTFLPQELVRHYKPPRESDRPAPSVNDPEADEVMAAREARDG